MNKNLKLKITIDSTGDLCPEVLEKYNMSVIPLNVHIGDKTYLDGVNVSNADVFDYYNATGQLATTSAPTPADYMEFFKTWTGQGYVVLYFGISPKFTSSFNNAKIAADSMENVHVIDSQSLSSGSGYLAIYAAELYEQGMTVAEILSFTEQLKRQVSGSFVLDTLKYMYKGGRCNGVQALGSNILGLKPCIEIREGTLSVGKKYRGKLEKILPEYIDNELKDKNNVDDELLLITHTGVAPEIVDELKAKIKSIRSFNRIIENFASSTVCVHCGPNTLGIFYRTVQ